MDNKRFMASILEIVVGAVLCIVSFTGVIDEYWGNMGGTLIIVGALMLTVAGRFINRLRDRAQQKLNRLPLPFLDMHPAGDIQSRLTSDMVLLSEAVHFFG